MPETTVYFSPALTCAIANTKTHITRRSKKREGMTADIRALESHLLSTGIQENIKLALSEREFPLPALGSCSKKDMKNAQEYASIEEKHFLHWTAHGHESGKWRLVHEVYQQQSDNPFGYDPNANWELISALPLIERPAEVRMIIASWLPRFVYQVADILDTQEHLDLITSDNDAYD